MFFQWFGIMFISAFAAFIFLIFTEEEEEKFLSGAVKNSSMAINLCIGYVSSNFLIHTFAMPKHYAVPIILGFLFGYLYFEGHKTDKFVEMRKKGEAFVVRRSTYPRALFAITLVLKLKGMSEKHKLNISIFDKYDCIKISQRLRGAPIKYWHGIKVKDILDQVVRYPPSMIYHDKSMFFGGESMDLNG